MLIRIAFLTGFVQMIASFWRYAYLIFIAIDQNVDISNLKGTLWEYVQTMFGIASKNLNFWRAFLIGFIIGIGYLLLYPIGHGMIVKYYQHKSGANALKTAWKRYFVIMITQTTLSIITLGSRHLFIFRYFYMRGTLTNILVAAFLILIGWFLVVTSYIYAYANISTVVDDFDSSRPVDQTKEALRNSVRLTIDHPLTTLKFLILSLILQLRFVLTFVLVIGIPAVVIRLALQLGLINETLSVPVVMIGAGILLVLAIYINSVIDAFFTVAWTKLYIELKEKDRSDD